MALTPIVAVDQELPTSIATQYTVPASTKFRATEFSFCNGSGVARTITVHIVESGDSPDVGANAWCVAFNLDPGVPWDFGLNKWLETGDSIRAFASGVDVTCHISGIQEA